MRDDMPSGAPDCRVVARFIADGYLRFDALVPDELNRRVMAEIQGERLAGCRFNDDGLELGDFLAGTPAYREILRIPKLAAAIRALVGDDPGADHCAVHVVPARAVNGQWWHADATIDQRTTAFDVQVFYFPHDTPREAGGTMFLPGSHFRRVHEAQTCRYQNFAGQAQTVCPAGTVMIAHHNLWHCGRPNHTDRTRYMVKLRLNPRQPQVGLFDQADIGDRTVGDILSGGQPWFGVEHRLEILQRLRLFRALTGTAYDRDLWLTRLEAGTMGRRDAIAV